MTGILVDIWWGALTVYMEAEGESYKGKLAVAFAIVNRMNKRRESITDIIFKAWQFSAWDTNSPTRMKIDTIDYNGYVWKDCVKAMSAAIFNLELDPIFGRTLYMNEGVVMAQTGKLPDWWKRAGERDPGIEVEKHKFRFDV